MTFSSDLNRIVNKTNKKFDELIRFVASESLNGVVMLSPVDKGMLRGNWQSTKTRPASGTLDVKDKDGGPTISKGEAVVMTFNAGDVFYVVNNLPYARRIEYGYSKVKAPKGMVRRTAKRVARNIKDEANRLNRK